MNMRLPTPLPVLWVLESSVPGDDGGLLQDIWKMSLVLG